MVVGFLTVQHILVKPKVKGVEGDEDLPDDIVYVIKCKLNKVQLCISRKNPYPPHGRSLEIPRGRGGLKAKFLEAMYENELEFPGGRGDAKQKTFREGSMDIFWNCTFKWYMTLF